MIAANYSTMTSSESATGISCLPDQGNLPMIHPLIPSIVRSVGRFYPKSLCSSRLYDLLGSYNASCISSKRGLLMQDTDLPEMRSRGSGPVGLHAPLLQLLWGGGHRGTIPGWPAPPPEGDVFCLVPFLGCHCCSCRTMNCIFIHSQGEAPGTWQDPVAQYAAIWTPPIQPSAA